MTRQTMYANIGNKAVDYGNPNAKTPAQLVKDGYKYVIRYLDGTLTDGTPGASWKSASKPELLALAKAGLGVMFVFERSADRWKGGKAAGREDGIRANKDAKLLGYPTTETILAAIDQDVTSRTLQTAIQYITGFEETCDHPVGVYGDYDVIDGCITARVGTKVMCQPNASWWSGVIRFGKFVKRSHPQAHLLQQTQTGGVDPNLVMRDHYVWSGPAYWDTARYDVWPGVTPKPTRRYGMVDDAARGPIWYAQEVIQTKAGGHIITNGKYDDQTKKRVSDLQGVFKITGETDMIGPKTWSALDFLVKF